MSLKNLIITTFDQTFKKYIYNEMVVGQLAHTEFKDAKKKGDEVDILMPGTVTMFDYDGGDLTAPEKAQSSLVKVKLNNGKAFHFQITEPEMEMIKNAPNEEQQINLIKDYSMDAVKQFADAVDADYAGNYTRAGYYLNDGTEVTLTKDNAKAVLSFMQAMFKRGDGKGHNSWVDGNMLAVLPPEFQYFLNEADYLKYTESGHKDIKKGFVGKVCGWDIVLSNNIKNIDGNYYPLFGIKGKTLAGGVSKDLNTKTYEPETNFNTAVKGYGIFGTGAPRSDLLGTAKLKITMSL